MKIILAPKACKESATRLANALGIRMYNPYKEDYPVGDHVKMIINYGCSEYRRNKFTKDFNTQIHARCCINKLLTFRALRANGLSVPEFTGRKQVASMWDNDEIVVCHTKRDGRKNEGIEYRHPDELVDAHVYTKYFFHKKEYRVLVFNHKVIGIYSKILDDENNWDLVKLQLRGFNEIIEQCEKASRAVAMDFVGFDVVANTRKDFKILEANSGPIITDEAIEAFKKFFN
jgi:hypothetical protein